MPRTDRSNERRAQLLPTVAATFAELGYRRSTTAELARRCGVHPAEELQSVAFEQASVAFVYGQRERRDLSWAVTAIRNET